MKNDAFDFKDVELFSGVEFEMDLQFETRYIKPPIAKEIEERNLKYSKAEDLAKDIKIDQSSRYYVILNGSFYFGDFIEALIVHNNYHVKRMTISTLSMNENNVDSLFNLMNGNYLDELNLIVSDYFFSHERNNLIKYLYERLDFENKFQLAVAGTHCKQCIFETHCGKKIIIHGSANLRSSGNIEQIVIEESAKLYDFNHKYLKSIIDQYKTINKSIRGKKLWQTVQTEKAE